jgi:hypothetical protein
MRSAWLLAAAIAAGMLLMGSTQAEDKKEESPKIPIKTVMKEAMAGGLAKKAAEGKATAEEVKKLADLFTALHDAKPPKGEAASWAMKTEALVKAIKGVAEGNKEAQMALGKAMNCAACHGAHKPPAPPK